MFQYIYFEPSEQGLLILRPDQCAITHLKSKTLDDSFQFLSLLIWRDGQMFGQKHVFVLDEGFQHLTDSQEVMKQSECRINRLPHFKYAHIAMNVFTFHSVWVIFHYLKNKPHQKTCKTRFAEEYITADYMRGALNDCCQQVSVMKWYSSCTDVAQSCFSANLPAVLRIYCQLAPQQAGG